MISDHTSAAAPRVVEAHELDADPRLQSDRSVVTGSMRTVRSAGTQDAISVTRNRVRPTAAKVSGSMGPTPLSSLVRSPAVTAAPATPSNKPIPATTTLSRTTSPTTSAGRAPRASRTPNSRVRWATPYDVSPYSPTAASSTARAAKTPSSTVWNRGAATDSAMNSSNDLTS